VTAAPVLHLDDWAPVPAGVSRAGSLYAVPAPLRVRAAHELTDAGWWVHVDLIVRPTAAGPDPDTGVTRAELRRVRDERPDARLDVHVIDLTPSGPGGGDGLARVLDDVLPGRPDRVVLPAARCAPDDPAARAVRDAGAALWAEAGAAPPAAGVDGLLVMLIDPGTTQSIDLRRLTAVRGAPPGLPVGVDGGVGRDHTTACLRAGARHLVSGRALLTPADRPTDHPAGAPPDRTKESERG